MSDNIFNIPNPDEWGCVVTHLAKGHGLLSIKLINKDVTDGPVALDFTHVSYYAGWTSWKGANFRFGTDKEYVDVLRAAAPRYQAISDRELLNVHPFELNQLFICTTAKGDSIYVIADAGWTKDAEGVTLAKALFP